MESTSISDVRRMCQRGAFRAYVQGGKVFLEDTATGQVVPLDGENGQANTERRAVPHREDRRGSRVERMFGARDTWKSADPDADQGPYRGFLIVQCEECGAIKAFCAKHETYGYKCGECGHETPLEKLRPLFMRLQRVVDCANEISAKYALEKQVRGEERAKATLVAAVWRFMPPFLLPALSAPKTEREAVQLAARRDAADMVMKIYVQAMHKALGFGADRVAVVVEETEGNFRQFGECTKDGEYYGYAVLARKIGQIIHDTVEVDTSGATEPVFGKTLF